MVKGFSRLSPQVCTASLLLMIALIVPARAVVLAPGNNVTTPGTSLALRPELAGSVLTNVTEPFVGTSVSGTNFTGELILQVVKETTAGTLDFYYQVINNSTSPDSLERVTTSNFTGFLTDVDFRLDSSGTVGSSSADRQASGNGVGFNFTAGAGGVIQPGATSQVFFVKTSATQFTTGTVSVIDTGIATVPGFSPIPEPSTGCLIALSSVLLLLGASRARSH